VCVCCGGGGGVVLGGGCGVWFFACDTRPNLDMAL